MRIVTTPMCEEVVKLAGIKDYKVNKNPDLEEGDLAILLSESKVKMDSLPIKLNTSKQLFESIREVSKLNGDELSEEKIAEFFNGYPLCLKYLSGSKNNGIKVRVYSNFLKDIVLDMGFEIVDDGYEYVVYPDYLKDRTENECVELTEIPTHSLASRNPFERIEKRYSILEKLI